MLTRASFFAALAIAALACAGCDDKPAPAPDAPAGTGAPAGTSAQPARAAAPAPVPAGTGKPTVAECDAIPRHFLELTLAEDEDMRKAGPAEREVMRKRLQSELLKDPDLKEMSAECAKDMPRKEYNCIMAAKTTKALDACTD